MSLGSTEAGLLCTGKEDVVKAKKDPAAAPVPKKIKAAKGGATGPQPQKASR